MRGRHVFLSRLSDWLLASSYEFGGERSLVYISPKMARTVSARVIVVAIGLFLIDFCACSFTGNTSAVLDCSSRQQQRLTIAVNGKPFPSLINVTLDDLSSGLKDGLFTSVDLVKVRHQNIVICRHRLYMMRRLTL